MLDRNRFAALAAFVLGMIVYAIFSNIFDTEQPPDRPLTMVIIPAAEAGVAREKWEDMRAYLEDGLGEPLELLLVSDYTAAVEALRYGHADIARLGPAIYTLATGDGVPIEPIVTAIKKVTGRPSYHSLIIAKADTVDLSGATFAYVDIASMSGYLAPATYVEERGIELGEVMFSGGHEAVILAVINGSVDAGAVADNRLEVAIEGGVIEDGDVTILWKSGPIPNSVIVVRDSVSDETVTSLKQLFLDAPREVVEGCGVGEIGYVGAMDSDYDVIREIQAALGE